MSREVYLEAIAIAGRARAEHKRIKAERDAAVKALLEDAGVPEIDAQLAQLKADEDAAVALWRELHGQLTAEREATLRAGTPVDPLTMPPGVSVRKNWAYNVTDPSAVPRGYLVVDLAAVKRAEQLPPGVEREPFYSLVFKSK